MKRFLSWCSLALNSFLTAVGAALISAPIIGIGELVYRLNKVVFWIALVLLIGIIKDRLMIRTVKSIIYCMERSDAICRSRKFTRFYVCGGIMIGINGFLSAMMFTEFASGNVGFVLVPAVLMILYGGGMIYRAYSFKKAAQ